MAGSGRLAGRSVVVTRATDQAGSLTELLRNEGAEVVEAPLISIAAAADGGAALRRAVADLARYDWVVVTSPNGATRVAAAIAETGAADPSAAGPTPADPGRPAPTGADRGRSRFAVVGRGTEAALGRAVDLVPTRHVAEGLLAEFPAGVGRVLLVQGDLARAALADGLAALGWSVDRVVAYRTVPAPVAPEIVPVMAAADAITFASGSAVRSFLAAAGHSALPSVVVSIGPATTEVARSHGVAVAATATDHSLAGLVEAVAEALRPG